MRLYGEISKTEAQDDGTLKVEGFASSEAVDSDGEIVTAEAMKAALPDYMKFGAVREMHQSKAAGTAIEAAVQPDGRTYFKAHIVDTEAVKKVNAGVYKGFSIGGKVTSRDELNKSTVTGLKLVEISLVDRPANQEAVFSLAKFEDDEDHDIKKYAGESIRDAGCAIDALSSIYYLYSKEVSETAENPDQVEALKSVIDNLKAFIASEIKEPDNSAGSDNIFTYAATTDDLNKSGAEISAKNKEKMQQIHDHAVSMGASCSSAAKAEGSEDLLKLQSENHDLKMQFQGLDTKNADLKKSLHDTTLELELIKAEPAPAKMALNDKGVVVSKAEDSAGGELLEKAVVRNPDGSINKAASLLKASYMTGGVTISR